MEEQDDANGSTPAGSSNTVSLAMTELQSMIDAAVDRAFNARSPPHAGPGESSHYIRD